MNRAVGKENMDNDESQETTMVTWFYTGRGIAVIRGRAGESLCKQRWQLKTSI
jgi:hypothetical protein